MVINSEARNQSSSKRPFQVSNDDDTGFFVAVPVARVLKGFAPNCPDSNLVKTICQMKPL